MGSGATTSEMADSIWRQWEGTGAWVEDFATEHYPNTIVCGSDLSNIQPACIMANSRYVVEDSEEEWNHDRPFDYIHLRLM